MSWGDLPNVGRFALPTFQLFTQTVFKQLYWPVVLVLSHTDFTFIKRNLETSGKLCVISSQSLLHVLIWLDQQCKLQVLISYYSFPMFVDFFKSQFAIRKDNWWVKTLNYRVRFSRKNTICPFGSLHSYQNSNTPVTNGAITFPISQFWFILTAIGYLWSYST